MDLNQLISKIPKPILVFAVLTIALVVIIFNNPLKDECEVQSGLFLKEMRGIITSVQMAKNKTQFAKLNFWKERCKEGNNPGSCQDYFAGLAKLTAALAVFPEDCQTKFIKENTTFVKIIADGIQIMALVAWGEKPPSGPLERPGWMNQTHIKTFCRLKEALTFLTSEEEVKVLKNRIYSEYPDNWPETTDIELRKPEERPKAFKSIQNPSGLLDQKMVYERSLFSMPCDRFQ